jgi:hypothetical protein
VPAREGLDDGARIGVGECGLCDGVVKVCGSRERSQE